MAKAWKFTQADTYSKQKTLNLIYPRMQSKISMIREKTIILVAI